jgi:hypothetical protein
MKPLKKLEREIIKIKKLEPLVGKTKTKKKVEKKLKDFYSYHELNGEELNYRRPSGAGNCHKSCPVHNKKEYSFRNEIHGCVLCIK